MGRCCSTLRPPRPVRGGHRAQATIGREGEGAKDVEHQFMRPEVRAAAREMDSSMLAVASLAIDLSSFDRLVTGLECAARRLVPGTFSSNDEAATTSWSGDRLARGCFGQTVKVVDLAALDRLVGRLEAVAARLFPTPCRYQELVCDTAALEEASKLARQEQSSQFPLSL